MTDDGRRWIRESRIPGLFRSSSLRLRGERKELQLAAGSVIRNNCRAFPAITERTEDIDRQPQRLRSLSLGVSSRSGAKSLTPNSSYRHTPTPSPEANDEDLDSLKSFGSVCSTASCDHAYFARNGTTFSGRRMKYVVHCSPHSGAAEEYLTPTQRANKQIKKLKGLLHQTQKDLEQKDRDIFRLTKEVVELRLFKASLSMDGTDSSHTLTPVTPVQDNKLFATSCAVIIETDHVNSEDESVNKETDDIEKVEATKAASVNEVLCSVEKTTSSDLPSSLADSGHFEDIASSSVHSKDSVSHAPPLHSPVVRSPLNHSPITVEESQEDRDDERRRLVNMYEKKFDELERKHTTECQELKEKQNDKVEGILQKLSDVNNSYCELRAEYDKGLDKIRSLEREAEQLRKSLEESEEKHKNMYLKMYMKGQEAARFEHADQVIEFAHSAPSRVSVPELLRQLQETESELENIKDKDYQPADSRFPLLSAKEAISLWMLGTRKAMYRHIVESESKKGSIDSEVTLQFLKSAVYYFLTDQENQQGHLNAIESILGFNDKEKHNIEKAGKHSSWK